jgi:hypothetical protein
MEFIEANASFTIIGNQRALQCEIEYCDTLHMPPKQTPSRYSNITTNQGYTHEYSTLPSPETLGRIHYTMASPTERLKMACAHLRSLERRLSNLEEPVEVYKDARDIQSAEYSNSKDEDGDDNQGLHYIEGQANGTKNGRDKDNGEAGYQQQIRGEFGGNTPALYKPVDEDVEMEDAPATEELEAEPMDIDTDIQQPSTSDDKDTSEEGEEDEAEEDDEEEEIDEAEEEDHDDDEEEDE